MVGLLEKDTAVNSFADIQIIHIFYMPYFELNYRNISEHISPRDEGHV